MRTPPAPRLPLPGTRAAPRGRGWRIRCQGCGEAVATGPGGRCPECDHAHALPAVPRLEDRLPARLAPLARHLAPAGAGLATWFRTAPWFFVFFWMGLLTGHAPLSGTFLGLCLWGVVVDTCFPPEGRAGDPEEVRRLPAPATQDLPAGATPRPSFTEVFRKRASLAKAWWQVNRIRERRGVSVHLDLRVKEMQGESLELYLRFRGPDGRLLPAALPNYRGPAREAMASHRTRPLTRDDSRFPDLWIFIPLRALSLPHGLARLEAYAELTLTGGGGPLLRHSMPLDLIPLPEDLWPPDSPALAGRGEGLLLAAVREAETVACGVCGDEAGKVDQVCPVCGAHHHRECWDYLDGCSRFGCPESPGRKQAI